MSQQEELDLEEPSLTVKKIKKIALELNIEELTKTDNAAKAVLAISKQEEYGKLQNNYEKVKHYYNKMLEEKRRKSYVTTGNVESLVDAIQDVISKMENRISNLETNARTDSNLVALAFRIFREELNVSDERLEELKTKFFEELKQREIDSYKNSTWLPNLGSSIIAQIGKEGELTEEVFNEHSENIHKMRLDHWKNMLQRKSLTSEQFSQLAYVIEQAKEQTTVDEVREWVSR